jgi:hypothetical protein
MQGSYKCLEFEWHLDGDVDRVGSARIDHEPEVDAS